MKALCQIDTNTEMKAKGANGEDWDNYFGKHLLSNINDNRNVSKSHINILAAITL